jgi:vitellogenic carboxypeptidase-like protein
MTNSPPEFKYFGNYLKLEKTRQAIHVNCIKFSNSNNTVEKYLINDEFQSVKPWFTTLINNYKTLIYSGQLDIVVAVTLTENFLKNLGKFF